MGLFIHSNLETILLQKRLTEMERTSEISTGLLILKKMLDQGQKPKNSIDTLDKLERLLPFLPEHQREHVLDQIVRPLLETASVESLTHKQGEESFLEVSIDLAGAPSDFEVEYQMMINRGDATPMSDTMILKYQQKKAQEAQARMEQLAEQQEKEKKEAQQHMIKKVEKQWNNLKLDTVPPKRQIALISYFLRINRFKSSQDYPILQKAKDMLKHLQSKST